MSSAHTKNPARWLVRSETSSRLSVVMQTLKLWCGLRHRRLGLNRPRFRSPASKRRPRSDGTIPMTISSLRCLDVADFRLASGPGPATVVRGAHSRRCVPKMIMPVRAGYARGPHGEWITSYRGRAICSAAPRAYGLTCGSRNSRSLPAKRPLALCLDTAFC
jgi:hypothetical protein